MRVSTKLYGIVGALALIGMLVAGVGAWYQYVLGEELRTATEKTAVKLDRVNSIRSRAWEMIASNREMFISISLKNQPGFEASLLEWNTAFVDTNELADQLKPLLHLPQSQEELEKFRTTLKAFEAVSADFARLCMENKLTEVAALVPKVQAFATTSDKTLTELRDTQRKFLKESQAKADSLRTQSFLVIGIVSCLLLVIVAASVFVVRGLNGSLIAAISELSQSADQVREGAIQVSTSSQSLAEGASEQAASLEETSASTEEINSMARKNSDSSIGAAGLVTKSQEKFEKANHALEQMVHAMGEINSQSGRISKIIRVIDEIAFQTNILALNAAVEAARAGEAGLGFAVVADEVRNLAQRSAQAAKDTSVLIEESIGKSKEGKTRVDEVASVIRSITAEATQVKRLVDEVSTGSEEQVHGIEQISKAITQMNKVTQQIAASAEQSAAAAQEMTAQSETLMDVVEQLSVMVGR